MVVGNSLALEDMDVLPVSSSMWEEQRRLEQTPRIQAFLCFGRLRAAEMSQMSQALNFFTQPVYVCFLPSSL